MCAAFIFSIQFKPVQTYVAKKAAQYLSKELKTRIELKSIYIKPFKSVVLEGLIIEDQEKDTLLSTPRLTLDITEFSLKDRKVEVTTAKLDNGNFYLKKYKDKSTNLDFIINYFDTGTTTPRTTPRRPYDVTFQKIVLNNIGFRYKNFQVNKPVNGVNFNDLHLRNLSTVVENLDTRKHLTKADFYNLTFREKSGFYLKNLTTSATIDTNRMEFSKLLLETPNTRISDYLLMEFKSFNDFGKFLSKVKMTAKFKNSSLNSTDIAYFAPPVGNTKFDFKVDGTVTGFADNFKARDLKVRTGKSTYFSGNFNVKGLPRIGSTYLDLNFKQLSTSKRDLNYILTRLLKDKSPALPAILDKFGNMNFAGRFKGYTNRFNTTGELKTRLGRIVANVNMLLQNPANPGYSGSVKLYDFNLAELLNNKLLGRATLATNIKGSGFNINKLSENFKIDATYFDFKGYRYNNILANGTFNNKLFNGNIKINDRNIKLNFNGGINLNPALPVFNFTASIRGANLHVLNLAKEKLQIDADINTNFSGNDLDNLQGRLEIRKARITDSKSSYVIDAVTLSATGLGNNRALVINSDVVDASITGQYHLKTLPAYFKSVVKSYIPSMDLKVGKYQPQNFSFKLNIKNFEPLRVLLAPELKIPEPAILNGRFISSAGTATLNGFAPLVQYKNIKIHNLIIDESTTARAMNIFITSDRVDLSETLFIQNVNIANILRNDSLNLNIKLADKDAVNQLDLNALVEFNTKSFANLSLLPSDVIINREMWRIQDQVRLGYNKGKFTIENFELFRDNQLLTINGIISNSPQDYLTVGFNKFRLTTLNPLTKSLGITLGGELNGDVQIAALTKTPHFDGKIRVDSLMYNNIPIGDLTLKAGFDNATKLVDVDAVIIKSGNETLDIKGTYNANLNARTLDLDMKLRENEIILFQPFLKTLVSNMTGTATADLKVSGKINAPRIDGTLSLNNAAMTIIYLKTNYHITDELKIENTIIKLDDIIIKDIKENQAIVNGIVDMRNPKVPIVNLTIEAEQFQTLNTTAKDNPLYYGVAYGTGTFRFNGPTDNMNININAKTEAGTVFTIPLNAAEKVGKNDFITFVAKDSSLTKKPETSFKGLVMNFDLVVDEESEVNIITDLGKLSGRGDAALNLNITSLGDFVMKGDYLISEGSFNFTAQDYINKVFDISQGGSIRWTGDPTLALINLRAIYGVRTSVTPLYQAANRQADNNNVLSQAVINLTGSILRPNISFDINFPANAYIKDELQSYLSDVNNLNQQALSLIVRRTFASGSGNLNIQQQATNTVLSAGAELAFNHINTILAQSLSLETVDFNIRNFNDASASIRFLNERLIITGGVSDRYANSQQFRLPGSSGAVSRDIEALYLVKKDGTLTLRASNRPNNRNFLNLNDKDNENVSALGLVYRQDFDNLNEFLQLLIGRKRREDRGVPPPIQTPKPPAINTPTASKSPD
ncbi:MAG TPA: translocation/assembly module TamB domain-containing protein [Sphingobacteriaceae bacterium]|nr:translocation/assembly module TamB domain-containing protein [Sphingobacteriaceae bacterium]